MARTTLPKAAAGSLQDFREIAQHAVGLSCDSRLNYLLGCGIDGDLAGNEHKSIGFDGLGIRPDRLRGIFG